MFFLVGFIIGMQFIIFYAIFHGNRRFIEALELQLQQAKCLNHAIKIVEIEIQRLDIKTSILHKKSSA